MRKMMAAWVVVLALGGAAACSGGPSSCEEAGCDPETQFCRFFGSDTLEPPTASCAAIPPACEEDLSCECLVEEEADSLASCDENGGLFRVIIPGG